MNEEEFSDNDGADPGLSENIYDGAEYELDAFGERIGEEDTAEEAMSEDEMADEEMKPMSADETTVEDGFGEAISPKTNEHIEDQLFSNKLHDEAEADNPSPDTSVQ